MALVCLCNGVSDRRVNRAIARGAESVAQIGETCRAGTTCFTCHDTLETLLAEARTGQRQDQPVMVRRGAAIA